MVQRATPRDEMYRFRLTPAGGRTTALNRAMNRSAHYMKLKRRNGRMIPITLFGTAGAAWFRAF